MSYREVDFNVVMDACYHWLKEYKAWEDNELVRLDQIKWYRFRDESDWITKTAQRGRVQKLLTLSKVPGSLNRIIHLSAEDAYILFGDL